MAISWAEELLNGKTAIENFEYIMKLLTFCIKKFKTQRSLEIAILILNIVHLHV